MKPFLKIFGVEGKKGLYPFLCDLITKDDTRKAVETVFSSKHAQNLV